MVGISSIIDYSSFAQTVEVSNVIVHEAYDPATKVNDIAVLKVAFNITYKAERIKLNVQIQACRSSDIYERSASGLLRRSQFIDANCCYHGMGSYDGKLLWLYNSI